MAKFINILDNLEIASYDGKKISLCTSEGKPVRIQIPRMYMPFGISGFVPEVGQTKWNIDFAMLGYDEENNYVNKFYNTLHKIEDKIIESVSEQSEHIFGKEMSVEQLRPMFNSNIKTSPGREPKFRIKVDTTSDNIIRPTVYDARHNDISTKVENGLYSRNSGTAIVELSSVYFLNRKFGVTWKLYQLVVYEPQRLKGFQFIT